MQHRACVQKSAAFCQRVYHHGAYHVTRRAQSKPGKYPTLGNLHRRNMSAKGYNLTQFE